MQFIKLNTPDGETIRLNVSAIQTYGRSKYGVTFVMIADLELSVTETPEQIDSLITQPGVRYWQEHPPATQFNLRPRNE